MKIAAKRKPKKIKKPKVWPPPEYALPSLKELERLSQPTLFVK